MKVWKLEKPRQSQYKKVNERKKGMEREKWPGARRQMSKKKGKENAVQRGLLPCDLHGRRPGRENERLHSRGFSDLWSYKYLVCGQWRSTSMHDLLPTEPKQEKKKKQVQIYWSGWLRGVLSADVWVSATYIQNILFGTTSQCSTAFSFTRWL